MWGVAGVRRVGATYGTEDAPVWTEPFDASPVSAQASALHACEAGRALDETHGGGHTCFIRHFADWLRELEGLWGFPAPPADFVARLDVFTLFASRRSCRGNSCNASCAALASEMINVSSRARPGVDPQAAASTLETQCVAFWRTSAPYLRRARAQPSLPDWSSFVFWSCPIDEITRACAASDAPPTLRGFYFTFDVRFSRFASASAARPYFNAFERLADESNAQNEPSFHAMQANVNWAEMRVEELLISSGFNGSASERAPPPFEPTEFEPGRGRKTAEYHGGP